MNAEFPNGEKLDLKWCGKCSWWDREQKRICTGRGEEAVRPVGQEQRGEGLLYFTAWAATQRYVRIPTAQTQAAHSLKLEHDCVFWQIATQELCEAQGGL